MEQKWKVIEQLTTPTGDKYFQVRESFWTGMEAMLWAGENLTHNPSYVTEDSIEGLIGYLSIQHLFPEDDHLSVFKL